jgi:tetratricopeptide (TPR) repeat protein
MISQKIIAAVLVFCFALNANAQTRYNDSVTILLTNTSEPFERFKMLYGIIENSSRAQEPINDSALSIELYQLAQQLNNDSLLAISYNIIGNYDAKNGDGPSALSYYFKAIPLAEKAKDKRRISSLYFDVTAAYFNLGNLEEGFKYNKKGGDNLPDKSAPLYDFMAEQFYRNMGRYYIQKNQPDSALIYIHSLEDISRISKDLPFQMVALSQNGMAYGQLGDTAMAAIYFKKASALGDSTGYTGHIITNESLYTRYLLSTNQIAQARLHAMKLMNLGKQTNNNAVRLDAAGFLKTVYSHLNQVDSAYFYLSMESALKDSIFSQNNLNKIQALSFNEEIRVVEKQAQETSAEEERKENIEYALISLGIIILLSLYLLLSRSFITSTKAIEFFGVIALLIVFEFLNLLLHPFLQRVTSHSPILMLLVLVCIAALLVPLHHRLEKWATKKLVEKNKEIRLAKAKKTIEKLEVSK